MKLIRTEEGAQARCPILRPVQAPQGPKPSPEPWFTHSCPTLALGPGALMGPATRDPGRLQEAAGSSVSLPASCFLLCGPERTPSEAEGTSRQPASMMDSAHKPQGQGPLGKPPRGSQGRGVPGPPHSGPAEGAGSSRPCCPRVIAATLCEGGRWARSRRVQSAPSSPATSRPLGFAHSPAAAAVGLGPEQAPARTLCPAWAAAGYRAPGAPGPSQACAVVGGLGAFESARPRR